MVNERRIFLEQKKALAYANEGRVARQSRRAQQRRQPEQQHASNPNAATNNNNNSSNNHACVGIDEHRLFLEQKKALADANDSLTKRTGDVHNTSQLPGAGDLELQLPSSRPSQQRQPSLGLVRPGCSMVHRMASAEPGVAMPELGKSTVDEEGLDAVTRWIERLSE